ncbi:unnamed protein product [Boreogadus saida]
MQTRLGLTSFPRNRPSLARSNSHMTMLKMASLLLILYTRLRQIPLAQGQIPRKDETTETTQTWKSQESVAGSMSARSFPPSGQVFPFWLMRVRNVVLSAAG